jgi:N-carbamoyl-L-amino-acid hydrolase
LLIGVVTGIVGIRTFKLTFKGEQNHAGSTPMEYRKDAASSLIKFAHLVDQEFSGLAGPRTVWTIGHIRLEPGSPSVIPGRAEMILQFRDTNKEILDALEAKTSAMAKQASGPVEVSMEAVSPWGEPAKMDKSIQETLAAAAEKIARDKWIHMPSGAGHDAQILARHLPSGMLFIPSIGGISHDIAEDTKEEDIVRGCRVLAAAAESLFKRAKPR